MPIFEPDSGRPRLVQPMQPLAGTFLGEVRTLLGEHLSAVVGEPLFAVRSRAALPEHTDVPELLALDVTGRPVVLEVSQVVDDGAIVAALRHAGAAARLTTADLARAYHPDPTRFTAEYAAFRDQVPFARPAELRYGTRLVLMCAEIAPESVDTLAAVRGPGWPVKVLQVGVVRGPDGARLLDVSPLAGYEQARRAVEPTSLRLVHGAPAVASAGSVTVPAPTTATGLIPTQPPVIPTQPPTSRAGAPAARPFNPLARPVAPMVRPAPTPVPPAPAGPTALPVPLPLPVPTSVAQPLPSLVPPPSTPTPTPTPTSFAQPLSSAPSPIPGGFVQPLSPQVAAPARHDPYAALLATPPARAAAPAPVVAPAARQLVGPPFVDPQFPMTPARGVELGRIPGARAAVRELIALAAAVRAPALLVWVRERRGQRIEATLRPDGLIQLPDGAVFSDPDVAATRAVQSESIVDGWRAWHLGDGGPSLAEVTGR